MFLEHIPLTIINIYGPVNGIQQAGKVALASWGQHVNTANCTWSLVFRCHCRIIRIGKVLSGGNKMTQAVYYNNDKTVLLFKYGRGLASCLQRKYKLSS